MATENKAFSGKYYERKRTPESCTRKSVRRTISTLRAAIMNQATNGPRYEREKIYTVTRARTDETENAVLITNGPRLEKVT